MPLTLSTAQAEAEAGTCSKAVQGAQGYVDLVSKADFNICYHLKFYMACVLISLHVEYAGLRLTGVSLNGSTDTTTS